MLSHKPSVLISAQSISATTHIPNVLESKDLPTQLEQMVELLLNTQSARSDRKIRLSDSSFTEELAWFANFKNHITPRAKDFRRVLRIVYHAGSLLENPTGKACQSREELLNSLQEFCNSVNPSTVLQRVLLSCELPLLGKILQTDISHRFGDWQTIVDNLTSIWNDEFDGEGMVASSDLSDFPEVLGSMARIIHLSNTATANMRMPEAVLIQFCWAVRHLLLICSSDGRNFGGNGDQVNADLVAVLMQLGGDPSDIRLADHLGLLPDPLPEFCTTLAMQAKRPPSSFHSEWAQIAVLRSGWGRKRRELAVSANGTQVVALLQCCGVSVLEGPIEFTLEVNGVVVEPKGTWMETCWQSDDDADYLEMELQLDNGWRIQRQFCVSRRTGAVLIADVVLGNAVATVRHTLKLASSASTVRFGVSGEGRELVVKSENLRGLVLPVGLSEWRDDRENGVRGELNVTDGLELISSGEQVSALYCPLFFALTPKAADKQFTWRRLVVGKKLMCEAVDQAAAVRIQVGGRQWLLYRSLTEPANRTFMGQNYASEFVFGEFLLDGKLKPYVEIS